MSNHGPAQESLAPSGGNISRNQIPKNSYLFVNFVNFYYWFFVVWDRNSFMEVILQNYVLLQDFPLPMIFRRNSFIHQSKVKPGLFEDLGLLYSVSKLVCSKIRNVLSKGELCKTRDSAARSKTAICFPEEKIPHLQRSQP